MAKQITQPDLDTLAMPSYRGIKFSAINPYELVREADNGTGRVKTGDYLIPHVKERMFEERKNYTYYIPFFRRIVNALVDPIFAERPKRDWDTENPIVDLFFKNCDKRGTPFSLFIQDNARRCRRYGCMFFVVDNVSTPSETLGEAIVNKERPFVYSVSPEIVKKIVLDEDGVITVFQFLDLGLCSINSKAKDRVYREIRADGWRVFTEKEKGKEENLSDGSYTIGRIPVVAAYDQQPEDEENPALPDPPLYHIAKMCLAGIYNMGSEGRETDRAQAFSLFLMPLPDGAKISTGVTTGPGNMITFNPKDGGKPGFATPDASIPEAMLEKQKFLIEQVFEAVSVVGVQAIQEKESGRAREITFKATSQNLQTFAEKFQSVELQIVALTDEMSGQDSKFTSEYSKNHGMIDLAALVQTTTDTLAIPGLGLKAKQQVLIDFIQSRFRDLDTDKLKALVDEAEQATFDAQHAEGV